MSLFIAVSVDSERCRASQPCNTCLTVCPVAIFAHSEGSATVIKGNEDECILCDLCLQQCYVDAIAIRKLYVGQMVGEISAND